MDRGTGWIQEESSVMVKGTGWMQEERDVKTAASHPCSSSCHVITTTSMSHVACDL